MRMTISQYIDYLKVIVLVMSTASYQIISTISRANVNSFCPFSVLAARDRLIWLPSSYECIMHCRIIVLLLFDPLSSRSHCHCTPSVCLPVCSPSLYNGSEWLSNKVTWKKNKLKLNYVFDFHFITSSTVGIIIVACSGFNRSEKPL